MKQIRAIVILSLLGILMLSGCAGTDSSAPLISASAPSSASSNAATPDASAVSGNANQTASDPEAIVRKMMELDYTSMHVAEFNRSIEELCNASGTNIFEVIAALYDRYLVDDVGNGLQYMLFPDVGLETFVDTTLEYSAQELFGEPVIQDQVSYQTMPSMTAADLAKKKQSMPPDEWAAFFQEHIAEINVFPVLSYSIEFLLPHPESLTVAERDSRLNHVRSGVRDYLLALSPEAVQAESLESDLSAELDRLSIAQSDDDMTIICTVQGLERNVD